MFLLLEAEFHLGCTMDLYSILQRCTWSSAVLVCKCTCICKRSSSHNVLFIFV